ncbi:MAG: leucine-rich repeat protein [Promethearchaeota archaeon]
MNQEYVTVRDKKKKYYVSDGFLNLSKQKINKIAEITNLKTLTTIKRLNLNYNQISDISGLESQKNLETLELEGNKLTEIPKICTFPHLTRLELTKNKISTITNLQYYPNLESLRLTDNKITEMTNIEVLPNLKNLDLENNEISKISGLKTLIHLKSLVLTGNKITEITGLDSLTKLLFLHLAKNKINEIKGLKSLTTLRQLTIHSNSITEIKGLETLSNLEDIYIENNKITEIKGLTSLSKLKALHIRDNLITDLKKTDLPASLKTLRIEGNPIPEKTLEALNIRPLSYYLEKMRKKHFPHVNNPQLLQQLMGGKKPSQQILDLVQQKIERQHFPIRQQTKIRLKFGTGPTHEDMVNFQHVGEAMEAKLHVCSLIVTPKILNCSMIPQEDPQLNKMKNLILYWYAQRWLPPITDYVQLMEEEGMAIIGQPNTSHPGWESMDFDKACRGLRPPLSRLGNISSYLQMTRTMGMGPITGQGSPVLGTIQNIKKAGIRLVKIEGILEEAQNEQETHQAYMVGIGLAIYWVMKHWIHIPIPGSSLPVFLPSDQNLTEMDQDRYLLPLPIGITENFLKTALEDRRKENLPEAEIPELMARSCYAITAIMGLNYKKEDLVQLCTQYVKFYSQKKK